MPKKSYHFKANVWIYPGPRPWHFVTLPVDVANEISSKHEQAKAGFGSLPVDAVYQGLSWKTSIFPDKETSSYLLPLKKEMRKKAGIEANQAIYLEISIRA